MAILSRFITLDLAPDYTIMFRINIFLLPEINPHFGRGFYTNTHFCKGGFAAGVVAENHNDV
jgi:hypothetical protein